MKAKMKTPYFDNEIGDIELWVTLNPNVSKSSEAKLAEYQQIKDTLIEYELNKEGLARVCAENQKLKQRLEKLEALAIQKGWEKLEDSGLDKPLKPN